MGQLDDLPRAEVALSVVDATACALVIHQNHGYAHVQGGSGETHDGPEGERNIALMGHKAPLTLVDATHSLTDAGLVKLPRRTVERLKHRLRAELINAPEPLKRFLRPLLALGRGWR